MTAYIYKCLEENCKDKKDYRFRGLCRSCTEYIGGEPVVPIVRVKHNVNGTLFQAYNSTSTEGRAITRKEKQAHMQAENTDEKDASSTKE